MKTFYSEINTNSTYAKINDDRKWHKVVDINSTKKLIRLESVSGYFEPGEISHLTEHYRPG